MLSNVGELSECSQLHHDLEFSSKNKFVFFPCFQNYNYVAVPMSISYTNSQALFALFALFARALQEIEIKQDVVGINFGHEEWPIY